MSLPNRAMQKQAVSGGTTVKRSQTSAAPKPAFNVLTNSTDITNPNILTDYYRNGAYELNAAKTALNVKYLPKTIAPIEQGPATIRVYQPTSNTDLIPTYTKFILESSQESHQERHQIIETFGDFYVFFFGESPPIYNYSGHLINAKNVNWVAEWQYYYTNYLRGTQCASENAKIILTYGNIQIEGFILSFSTQHNAATEVGVPVQFNIVQTSRINLNTPDDFGLSYTQEDLSLIQNLLSSIAGKEGKGTSENGVSEAFGKTNSVMGGGLDSASSILSA